jgi:hypothetical protein
MAIRKLAYSSHWLVKLQLYLCTCRDLSRSRSRIVGKCRSRAFNDSTSLLFTHSLMNGRKTMTRHNSWITPHIGLSPVDYNVRHVGCHTHIHIEQLCMYKRSEKMPRTHTTSFNNNNNVVTVWFSDNDIYGNDIWGKLLLDDTCQQASQKINSVHPGLLLGKEAKK